jgi:tRNA1Val (adenine37-N6)-methyltransferase
MKVTTDTCLFGAWVGSEVRGHKTEGGLVLDVGSGTGLLSLMLAQKNPNLFFDSIEIDKEAAKQAQENAAASPWKARIRVINTDVKCFTGEKKYDLIVSNPPFYEKEIRSAKDSKNIAHHSEELKLDELLTIIKNNLATNGSFFLLLPYKRNEEIKKVFNDHQLYISKILLAKQSTKHNYFRVMIKGNLFQEENEEIAFDEISIRDAGQQYTGEFKALLKDYYLHL